jgi:hypothetical protein
MELPLVQHGPSPEYGTSYYYSDSQNGSRIIAVSGSTTTTPLPTRQPKSTNTFLDRLFKIDHVHFSPSLAAEEMLECLPNCETPKRKPRRRKLASIITSLHEKFESIHCKVSQLTLFGKRTPSRRDHGHEPHSKTTRSRRTYSRMPSHQRILSDNARTCRTTRSQQSYGIRTNRSIDSQRCAHARTKQGTLFIDCA